MSESLKALTDWLKRSIELEDRGDAVQVARLLLPFKDKIRVKARAPTVDFQVDEHGQLRGFATSIHSLHIGGVKICEWVRQSIAGYGQDLNRPDVWAAVASDPDLTRYRVVVKATLDALEIDDRAPRVPEPPMFRGGEA
ncbi:MAG: hypothetical protein GY854_34940 [Deltaproteobacteria bacterium]|nr:hypothetical protein [Deltaproteobacteria bacterium]